MNVTTIEKALSAVVHQGYPSALTSAFICPHCQAHAQHEWGVVSNLLAMKGGATKSRHISAAQKVILAHCTSCDRESVLVDGKLVSPSKSDAPLPNVEMPSDVKIDFEEARRIYHLSPRGAAALLRLCIQKLCPILGSSEKDINSAVGELVNKGIISSSLQQALDSVRVIGNEAVHPGIMDLRDDTTAALSLFTLVNFIVEKGIAEPKRISAIYQALPAAKLAGIAQRDKPKP